MSKLLARAFLGLTFLLAVMAGTLFGCAGTLDYCEAWVFLAVFGACVTAITIDLARRSPALLERRVKAGPAAEPTRAQQVIQSFSSLAFIAIFVVAGLDHRFGWSDLPRALIVIGDVIVVCGLWIVQRVFRANVFTSAVIEVEREQQVVDTGPYAFVRHPMYAGAAVLLVGTAIALRSPWSACAVAVLLATVVWRLLAEERLLVRDLAGYAEYRSRVRYRLIPRVW